MNFDWCDYLPLAKAETSRFYKKQERGKFRDEELLSEAVNVLATSLGANYAKVAIRGALNDFARESHKLVRDVEMSEEEYLRTRGNIAPKQAAIRRVYVSGGIRHTLYTPGAYRTNHELLAGDGKVSSKHGKVSVAIERSSYHDERSQAQSGWKRAKVEDDQQEYDPRSARMATPRGDVDQGDYVGRGREKRFSASFLNAGEERKSGPGERFCDGRVSFHNPNRKTPPVIRRIAVAAKPTLAVTGRRTSRVIVDLRRFGLEPVPKDKLGRWREELLALDLIRQRESEGREPIPASPLWHKESGSFRLDWGFPDRPNGWGDNWIRTYLDRWETVKENNFVYLRLKSSIWGDVIDRDVLAAPTIGSTFSGGSQKTEPLSFVPEAERRTQHPAGVVAPTQILSSFRPPEMAPELFLNQHDAKNEGLRHAK